MPAQPQCPDCGGLLPEGQARGLCPRCALSEVLKPLSAPTSANVGMAGASADRPCPSADPTPQASLPAQGSTAGRFIGDYELLEEIARGGMGVVFKARQTSLDRVVAVKLLLSGPHTDAEFIKRFRVEASAAAALQHPNIVAIHEVGVHGGEHFIVMEFVDGPNLAKVVREQPMRPKRAAAYLKTIAEAVHFAHERGILHRDLKPSNVLLDTHDQPRVTDFGLAKRVGTESQPATDVSQITLTGQVMGSPGYMPPEQASGRRGAMSRRSDVYSLGATLYHLLTGRPPFGGGSVAETLRQVETQEPVSLRLLNPGVPLDLETLCLKCLQKEPQRRYATAQELAEELGRYLNDESIRARPIGRPEKIWRWCRRKPAVAGLGATIVLLLLGVAIGASVFAARVKRDNAKIRKAEQDAVAERNAATTAGQAEAAQRLRAEQERDRARRAEQESRQVLHFFERRILAAARPAGEGGGLGREATIREAIEAAEDSISRSFTNQPLVEASIRSVMGETYLQFGHNSAALRHFEKASALRRAWLGPTNDLILDVLIPQAAALSGLQRFREAAKLGEEALRLSRQIHGPTNHSTLSILNNLAMNHYDSGNLGEAIPMLEEVLDLRRAALGTNYYETVISMSNLGRAYMARGDLTKATPLYEEVLRIRQATDGPGHSRTLLAMNNLASAYIGSGRSQEGYDLLEAAYPLTREKLGPGHPRTLTLMLNLAGLYKHRGQPDKRMAILQEGVRLAEKHLGPSNRVTLQLSDRLADACIATNGVEVGLAMLEANLVRWKSAFSPGHPDTLNAMSMLAESYRATGRSTNSAPILMECLVATERKLGPDDAETDRVRFELAKALEDLEQFDKAEKEFRTSVEWNRKRHPAPSMQLAKALGGLGQTLLLAHKPVEAESAYQEALEIFRQMNPGGTGYFSGLAGVGSALSGQRKFTEAEPLLLEAYNGLLKHGHGAPSAARARSLNAIATMLANLYEAWDKPDQAAHWRANADKPSVPGRGRP